MGRDAGRNNHYFSAIFWDWTGLFFPTIFWFRTSFPVLERTFPVLERPLLFYNVLWERRQSWDFCSCPCPGQRDIWTRKILCPGTKPLFLFLLLLLLNTYFSILPMGNNFGGKCQLSRRSKATKYLVRYFHLVPKSFPTGKVEK